jgi:hypothetical protein
MASFFGFLQGLLTSIHAHKGFWIGIGILLFAVALVRLIRALRFVVLVTCMVASYYFFICMTSTEPPCMSGKEHAEG